MKPVYVICGTTRYMSLIREYIEGSREISDRFFEKGVRALMLVMTRPEGMSDEDFLNFRYKVEDRLQELFDKSVVKGMLLGGAYAPSRAYIDLLLYDGRQFVDYLRQPGVLDQILTLDDGTICQTKLEFKDFI